MTFKPTDFHYNSSDEALVRLAQTGVTEAETVLLQRYRPFVQSIASNYSSFSLEADDIVQEGFLGLLSAVCSFSEEKKVTFKTYAAVCISNSIKTALKVETRLKNTPLNSYIPIENVDIASGYSPEEIFISDENADRIKKLINSSLSPLEKKVLFFHIAGSNYKNTAESLAISEKSVDNALQRIRLKLSGLLKENGS